MRPKATSLVVAVLCLWSVNSCGGRPFPEWPTPVPQTYTLVPAAGWEDLEIRSVCLSVEETYDFGSVWSNPTPPEELYEDQSIQDFARGFLELLGVEVVAAGSACDASLILEPVFTPLGEFYTAQTGFQGGTCYTGANLDLGASLVAPGRATLACDGTKRLEPPDWSESCPSPANAPYRRLHLEPLPTSLLFFFGSNAYCPLLVQLAGGIPTDPSQITLFEPEEAAVAIPCLVELLRHSDRSIRFHSIGALSWFGPRAKGAVPYLLQLHLDDANPDAGLPAGALRRITGVGVKPDAHDPPWADEFWSATEWRNWWDDQDVEDWGF